MARTRSLAWQMRRDPVAARDHAEAVGDDAAVPQPGDAADALLRALALVTHHGNSRGSRSDAERVQMVWRSSAVVGAAAITTLRSQQASRPEDQICYAPRNQTSAA